MEIIGSEIFEYKIDYTKIRKNTLKQFVKTNKKKIQVNITGLTKKELIEIVETLLLNIKP